MRKLYFRHLVDSQPGLFHSLTRDRFDPWCGRAFEHLCLQNIPTILNGHFHSTARSESIWFLLSVLPNQSDGVQIDLAIERQHNVVTLVECKFRNGVIGSSVIDEFQQKTHRRTHSHKQRRGQQRSEELILFPPNPRAGNDSG